MQLTCTCCFSLASRTIFMYFSSGFSSLDFSPSSPASSFCSSPLFLIPVSSSSCPDCSTSSCSETNTVNVYFITPPFLYWHQYFHINGHYTISCSSLSSSCSSLSLASSCSLCLRSCLSFRSLSHLCSSSSSSLEDSPEICGTSLKQKWLTWVKSQLVVKFLSFFWFVLNFTGYSVYSYCVCVTWYW